MPVENFLFKRRNVYRAALIYAAAGWVLLQIADIVFLRLGLPEQTVNYVLLLAALGLPFAIVFAWFFDITPEGIVRTPPLASCIGGRWLRGRRRGVFRGPRIQYCTWHCCSAWAWTMHPLLPSTKTFPLTNRRHSSRERPGIDCSSCWV